MKFKFLILIFTIVNLVGTHCIAQQNPKSLSLQDAIQNALTNQPLLKQAEEQINAAEAKINQQKTYYYPEVEGDISYTRIGPIPAFNFAGQNLELAPNNNYDFHVSAKELLYDFGKRDALVELAKSYKLSSEDKIALIKNNLAYQTTKAFYSVLFLEKGIAVKDEQINNLNSHIEMTTKKVNSGSATDYDILITKVKLAAVQNQKIDLQNSLTKAKIYLNSLMGWKDGQEFNLSGDFNTDSTSFNSDSLLAEAYAKRPEMTLAKDAEKSADLNKQLVSLSDRPMLGVFANYGFKNGYEPNIEVLRGNWAAGLNAKIPIFNGNLKDSKVEEAEANMQTASAKILELERNIKTDVQQSVADYNSNLKKFRTARLQVEQAKQAVQRAEISYRDGVITNLDLIDAETSLTEAEFLNLKVAYENVVNLYSIKMSVGEEIK